MSKKFQQVTYRSADLHCLRTQSPPHPSHQKFQQVTYRSAHLHLDLGVLIKHGFCFNRLHTDRHTYTVRANDLRWSPNGGVSTGYIPIGTPTLVNVIVTLILVWLAVVSTGYIPIGTPTLAMVLAHKLAHVAKVSTGYIPIGTPTLAA